MHKDFTQAQDTNSNHPNWQHPWAIANWKMNPTDIQTALALVDDLTNKLGKIALTCNVCLAPNFLHLNSVATALQNTIIPLRLGAQNLCAFSVDKGAYTGEISASQLAELGVTQVIIGHSERRAYFAENNDILAKKIACALQANLDVIFCVGETETQYDNAQTKQVIAEQLSILEQFSQDFANAINGESKASRLIVAYEPVWAIGTGKVPTVEEVDAIHAAIKTQLASLNPLLTQTPVLYGGSVKADNAMDFAKSVNVDGVLVGGASLDAESFFQIINAFNQK